MNPVENAEKRKHPRVPARGLSAQLSVAHHTFACDVENISAGGVFLMSGELLPIGLRVGLSLSKPGGNRAIKVSGVVVAAMDARAASQRGYPPGMRFQFDEIPPESKEVLARILVELGAPSARTVSVPPPSRASVPAGASLLPGVSAPRYVSMPGVPTDVAQLKAQIAEKDRRIQELEMQLAERERDLKLLLKGKQVLETAVQRLSATLTHRR